MSGAGSDDLLTTQEAADLLGVGVTSIKRWADSGTLECVKTPGGHRRIPRRALIEMQSSAIDFDDSDREQWIDLLLAGKGTAAIVDRLCRERALLGSWLKVGSLLGPVIDEVGERWARGTLSVMAEHAITERLARALSRISDEIAVPDGAPACLVATATGDDHTLGLYLIEPCLREAGFRVSWVGRQAPIGHLVRLVESGPIRLVALSASRYSADAPSLAGQADQIGEACRRSGANLLLGGHGAWPDRPRCGVRIRTFAELDAALARIAAADRH